MRSLFSSAERGHAHTAESRAAPGGDVSSPAPSISCRNDAGGMHQGRMELRKARGKSSWVEVKGRRRLGRRLGCPTEAGATSTAFWVFVRHVAVLLLALLASGTVQGEAAFRICLDFGTRNTGHYLTPSMLVAYNLAAEHIASRNCTYIPQCEALLSEETPLQVEFKTWHTSALLVESAEAAMECSSYGGDLYILGPSSLVQTVLPINTVNQVTTASAVLSRSTRIKDASFFRTHHPASLEAKDLVELAHYFQWDRVLVLYDEDAAEFVATMVDYGNGFGVEVGAFSVGTDFPSKMNAVLEFGSSIVILPSFCDFEGDVKQLHEALRLCDENGLLGPQYTWIGSYHLSRTFFVFNDDSEDDQRLERLVTSMLFHRLVPTVGPTAEQLWDDHAASSNVAAVVEKEFEELKGDGEWWEEARGQFLTEFAVAYDTMWLAAAAFSKCPGSEGETRNDSWINCVNDVEFMGVSGDFNEGGSLFREVTDASHYGELFTINKDNNGHHLHDLVAYFKSSDNNISFVDGRDRILWRDGSSYPGSIPIADIRTDEAGANKDVLYGSIGAMVFMLALLLLVCAGYRSLRKELNTIAVMTLDVDSPVVKAVQLLQVVSRRMILTKTVREEALRIAMSLSHAENVHAPDLASQADKANADIMKYLMFRSAATTKSSDPDKSVHNAGPVKVSANGDMEIQEIGDGVGEDSMGMHADECIEAAVSELVPKIHMPLVETAGEDLFFNTALLAECSGGKPLLCACLQVIRHRQLAVSHDLVVPKLVAYISFIEEGYYDVPYHNATHAADVLLRLCAILSHDHLFTDPANKNDSFLFLCAVIAAAVHDYQHPGLNNAFQVATDSEISREFNEQMVLENLSLSRALRALRTPELNFIERWDKSKQQKLCSNVINLVLATDMSRHFDLMSSFQGKIVPLGASATLASSSRLLKHRRGSNLGSSLNMMPENAPDSSSPLTSPAAEHNLTKRRGTGQTMSGDVLKWGGRRTSAPSQPLSSQTDIKRINSGTGSVSGTVGDATILEKMDLKMKVLMLQMAIKIADIGHMTTHFDMHYKWSQRLEDEFFVQGDKERALGLEISPLMNREKPGVMDPNNQKTFCNIIVLPMLECWQSVAPYSARLLLKEALNNKLKWERGVQPPIVIE